jgi:hypothetical protein
MGASTDQPHQPADAPDGAGGQWAEKAQTTPEAPLVDATVGTFLFPPIDYGPNGVQGYLHFWETAPVSDRVLSNLVATYELNRIKWIGDRLDEWANEYGNSVEGILWSQSKGVSSDDIQRDHDKARAAELKRLEAERPIKEISPMSARGIAIAAQMYRCSGDLSEEDQKVVDNHVIPLSREGKPWTVESVWRQYHLAEIADRALVDQDIAVASELAELRRHLGAIDTI